MSDKARSSSKNSGRPKDAAKRTSIVRAATRLFMQNGFELTSMEEIAKKADVSKLTIYSHFADKDELFREIMRQRCDRFASPDNFTALAQLPPEQGLMQLARNFTSLIFSSDSLKLQRVIYAEAARRPKIVEVFYSVGPKRVRAAFADLLAEWRGKGLLSLTDIPQATDQFFSLLKGEKLIKALMFNQPLPKRREQERHIRATVDFFLKAYGPKSKKSAP